MTRIVRRYAAIAILGVALVQVWAQRSYVESNYTKQEYRVAMRDGKKLFTAVYTPRDQSRPYPIMLTRTPYGVAPYGKDKYRASLGPSDDLAHDGFIFAYQDVRGRMMSEGEFVNMTPHRSTSASRSDIDESTDAYDTIEWLIRNIPNNNGRVGLWGISYPGFYAASGMIDAHPALKAVSPQAPIADWFIGDDFHHNGAFFLAHAFGFLSSFGWPHRNPTSRFETPFKFPTSDGYEFYLRMGPLSNANQKYLRNKSPFWNEMMEHGTYDEFWQARNLRPHLRNVKPAVMTVGGWFDAEDLFGTLEVYRSVEESSPGAFNILVMGPWYHGAWARANGNALGSIDFGSNTSVFYRREIELPFFRYFLKGAGDLSLPEAFVFATGKNEWQKQQQWPPRNTESLKLYFCPDRKLSINADPEFDAGAQGYDEYVSDPENPVPYTTAKTTRMAREYMVGDQRFASRRPDVLTYQTEVLSEDVLIAGPVTPRLNVSTTGTDSDFIVKLIDVYPGSTHRAEPDPDKAGIGGYQQLVRGEPFRGKFRNSFSNPEPFTPGKVTRIEYKMPDVFHMFKKGHRIMVQIQSSWFPLVDRNPQQFVDIYKAKPEDFKKVTQRIYRSRTNPSYIELRRLQ